MSNDFKKLLGDKAKALGLSDADMDKPDPIQVCERCNNIGYLLYQKYEGYPPAQLPCTCWRADEWQAEEQLRRANLLSYSNVPERYRDARLETWLSSYETWTAEQQKGKLWAYFMAQHLVSDRQVSEQVVAQDVLAYSQHVPQWLKDLASGKDDSQTRASVVLSGGYGVGKTHLAAAISNGINQSGVGSALFVTIRELFEQFRATWQSKGEENTEGDLMFRYTSPSILVIDDMIMEAAPKDYQREYMRALIRYRYDQQKAMIITTNFNRQQFTQHWGGSIAHPLMDIAHWIPVAGASLRHVNNTDDREVF